MSVLDFNFDFNAGLPPAFGSALRFRPRFNSDLEGRLVDTTVPANLVPPPTPGLPALNGQAQNYPPFHPSWDAELQAYMFLDDFIAAVTAAAGVGATWRDNYVAVARAAATPPNEMDQATLGGQVLGILELALEREDRFAEVIDQDDGDGAINYWLGMLKIDPARHPGTNLMVRVGRRIGEHVSMCLKGHFMSPRPSQLCPAITPMIDPPATPSFPAGHAVQSYLISYLLSYSLQRLPQHTRPANRNNATGPLIDLAARVSQNREVAGVHFRADIDAGQAVAVRTFNDLRNVPSVWGAPALDHPADGLRHRVQEEFPQYA